MAGNSQTKGLNQSITKKENTKNSVNQELVRWQNRYNRKTLSQAK